MFNYALGLALLFITCLCACQIFGAQGTVVTIFVVLLGIASLVAGIMCFAKGKKI